MTVALVIGASVILALWLYTSFIMPWLEKLMPRENFDERTGRILNRYKSSRSGSMRQERYQSQEQLALELMQSVRKGDKYHCRFVCLRGSAKSIDTHALGIVFTPHEFSFGDEITATIPASLLSDGEMLVELTYHDRDGRDDLLQLCFIVADDGDLRMKTPE